MRTAAFAALLLLAGCGEEAPIPPVDHGFEVRAGAEAVEPGAPFPLTVVRTWEKSLVPAAWDDRTLAPLALHLESASRREDSERIQETRRFRAHAFSLKEVALPSPAFAARPREGGKERVARAERLLVRVVPVLDPANPGAPELPGDGPAEPSSPWPWAGGAALLLLAATLLVRGLRRRSSAAPAPLPPAASPVVPSARALGRIAAIGSRSSRDSEAVQSDVLEVCDVVRDYLSEGFGLDAREKTTEEILSHELPARKVLAAFLSRCDIVKFASAAPTAADRAALLDAARSFVEAARDSEPTVMEHA